jgi:transposase
VKIREDRELVRRRLKVAENLSRVKTGIGSLLRMHGIQKPEDLKTAWTQKHVAWVKGLSQHAEELAWTVRTALASQVRELEFYRGEIDELDAQIEKLQQEEGYATAAGKMREIPGVGRLTAMTFLVELGDVKRFKNRRQLASYLGLTPNCYESGEASDRKGHISRMGPARIRKVLNQAALCLLRLDPTWKPWYDQLSRRRGTKRAIVATMRRLGIAMWQKARTA